MNSRRIAFSLAGTIFCACAALLSSAGASPAVPSGKGSSLRRQMEFRLDKSQIHACFSEAAAAESNDWETDTDVAESEQQDNLQASFKSLSADAEATQLPQPDPLVAVRRSQVVFQHCLQQQLIDQHAPPL